MIVSILIIQISHIYAILYADIEPPSVSHAIYFAAASQIRFLAADIYF